MDRKCHKAPYHSPRPVTPSENIDPRSICQSNPSVGSSHRPRAGLLIGSSDRFPIGSSIRLPIASRSDSQSLPEPIKSPTIIHPLKTFHQVQAATFIEDEATSFYMVKAKNDIINPPNNPSNMITKRTLAQMLSFFAEDGKKHHIVWMKSEKSARLTEQENIELNISLASNCACTKIIQGTLEYDCEYLVSRGEELGFGLKPDVVCEYSSHWPWVYCYLYKL